ncbi:hypothetical protein RFI_01759 [Reticulomyxa filosa]|uniref:Uncharacterized protein n=1 Tax=Reticulomyxa filosa TaxID=46433 RepID=X6PB53_RETFI|nr:hypothetical protein RFI_01759 [Reticulomyxa filosa]|eukprot:ETO35304.1 hypothetical protein RFI_01759 [Reticulomyxa filosa]
MANQLQQLQENFITIKKKIVSQIWECCDGNFDEATTVLRFVKENNTPSQHQKLLIKLLRAFDKQISRAVILETWKEYNQIFIETLNHLNMINSARNINEVKENSVIKIIREMCIHILWNILKHPANIKYRQINHQTLSQNLKKTCVQFNADFDEISTAMEYYLQEIGFEKGNDENWYYHNNIQLLELWKHYQKWIYNQIMYLYKIRNIPQTIHMISNGKWKEYAILLDYGHRSIVLLNENKKKQKKINSKNITKFNVHIEYRNNHTDIDSNYTNTKYACISLNHSWYFRLIDSNQRNFFSDVLSVNILKRQFLYCTNRLVFIFTYTMKEFNSFNIIWKDKGFQHLQNQYQLYIHFIVGTNEVIYCKFVPNECSPSIEPHINTGDVLLHDIYKHCTHYPIIQVYWEIKCITMVSYKCTIAIERNNLPKSIPSKDNIPLNEKPKFDPFLYERDLYKVKIIQDNSTPVGLSIDNLLKSISHEIIKNKYLCDLISENDVANSRVHKEIKRKINYNKKNSNELILNDKILTILNELKTLYYDEIHKQMGYPLQLYHICAILLYCGKTCNIQFSRDQIQFKHHLWPFLDFCLQDGIHILHKHERREESAIELYCGLRDVRLENIKEIKAGYFINYVSTSDDIQIAQMYRSDQGCILHFHPSMRRTLISSCDVSWISPYKHEREILFARSVAFSNLSTQIHEELSSWNAKVEREDEYTQTILLTCAKYDAFLQQTIQISAMWNHSIDLNVVYLLLGFMKSDIYVTTYLSLFNEWQIENVEKYLKRTEEFKKRRCCNHLVNLLSMFLFESNLIQVDDIEYATAHTVIFGLPFVENDKKNNIIITQYSKILTEIC